MKVIFSSLALWKVLSRRQFSVNGDRAIKIEFINSSMVVDGIKELDITRQHDGEYFEFIKMEKHLGRLRSILSSIPDQPITLNFTNDNSWIEIKHIEC